MLQKTALRSIALLIALTPCLVSYLTAQEQQDASSVAEAAKRSRQQKQASSKPTTVVTNDTLPPVPAGANGAGSGTPAAPEAGAAAEAQPEASAEDADQKKAANDSLKKEIQDKEQKVNLLQRELALEQDIFYGKQDYQRDAAGKEKLDSLQSDLKQQQDELAALKTKLAEEGNTQEQKEPATAPPATPAQPQS